ncbi:hypothetical protein [Prevotella sp.]|uniref:hypothetical protein n=1 Tax=Prevotella sp. TaxID=59823 RepID=UPI002F95060D
MKTIKINNKDYKIKYTIRALFIFEQITHKPFAIKSLLDNYIFFYCLILANNKDNVLDWDEFIDALDSDSTLLKQLTNINEEALKKDAIFNDDSSNEKKS